MESKNLKDFVKKEVYFNEEMDSKTINIKNSKGESTPAIIRILMKEFATFVYVEDGEIKEITLTANEALNYISTSSLSYKEQITVKYSATLSIGDLIYIDCEDYTGFTFFEGLGLKNEKLILIYLNKNGSTVPVRAEIDKILNGEIIGEVWEKT